MRAIARGEKESFEVRQYLSRHRIIWGYEKHARRIKEVTFTLVVLRRGFRFATPHPDHVNSVFKLDKLTRGASPPRPTREQHATDEVVRLKIRPCYEDDKCVRGGIQLNNNKPKLTRKATLREPWISTSPSKQKSKIRLAWLQVIVISRECLKEVEHAYEGK
jgi:hypothetical protein